MVCSCSAFIWQDNIPPACATQVVTLRLSFRIYPTKLHTICGHNRMMHDEHALCLYPAKWHTVYEQKHERPWARHSSSIWWPHILPVSEQTRGHDKHTIRQLSVHTTYFLSAKTPVMMGTSISIQPMSRRTSCGWIHRTPSGLLSGSILWDHSPTVGANTRMQNGYAILDL